MEGPRDCHTEWSKSEKKKCHMILPILSILKRSYTNELIMKQTHRLREWAIFYGEMWGEGIIKGVWDWHVHTAIFRIDNQQGPTIWYKKLCSILFNSLNGKRIHKLLERVCKVCVVYIYHNLKTR